MGIIDEGLVSYPIDEHIVRLVIIRDMNRRSYRLSDPSNHNGWLTN